MRIFRRVSRVYSGGDTSEGKWRGPVSLWRRGEGIVVFGVSSPIDPLNFI